ncbi:MAG: hypothetical protein HQ518_02670 [Rhodopirellula sp.]|nr:hypothetical protein [Rhodopirellula sp.]
MRNTQPKEYSEILASATVKATMFSNATSILTMMAMLLHSILGCCSHHAHACEHGLSVSGCQAEHHEHCREAEQADHIGHQHQGDRHDHHAPQSVVDDHSDDSAGHSHEPCRRSCEGGDCRFTQSSQVKTPTPDEGRLSAPAATPAVADSLIAAQVSAVCVDAGPLRDSAAGCHRLMTQVWRL